MSSEWDDDNDNFQDDRSLWRRIVDRLAGGSIGPVNGPSFTWWWWDQRTPPNKRPYLNIHLQVWRLVIKVDL